MGRALRFQTGEFESVELTWRCLQGRFLLRTWRCLQGRFLLRPGPEANRRMLGVIGQAMRFFAGDVRLYFAGGTCNHIHIVAAFRSADVKAGWTCHVRTNLSKELGDLYDWRGCHWERRSTDIPILDEATLLDRLVYLAGQTTKAGLVRRAAEWPGVPWTLAVTEGRPLVGVWYDRTRLYRLRMAWEARPKGQRGRRPVLADVAEARIVELTPPPMWAELAEDEQRARWCEVIETAETRYPAPTRVLGPAAVLRVKPHDRPERSKRSPAPAVHASSRVQRLKWRETYRAFVETYRSAMKALRAGVEGCGFPSEGCRPVSMSPVPGG